MVTRSGYKESRGRVEGEEEEDISLFSYEKRGAKAPCIILYRETFSLFPKKKYWQAITRLKDIELWESILTVWKGKKWNPLNVERMLEYYYRGVVPGLKAPAPVETEQMSKGEAGRILAQIGKLAGKIGKIR